MTKENLEKVVLESFSINELCKKLGFASNGRNAQKIKNQISQFSIDTSHFLINGKRKLVWEKIEKKCPVCSEVFKTQKDHPKAKMVCSISCSNTYFRSGENNGRYKNGTNGEIEYRTICFKNHKKECIICGFDKIVDVHHIDKNHKNNDPKNLVPLCPNHHKMMHTYAYKDETIIELNKKLNEKL